VDFGDNPAKVDFDKLHENRFKLLPRQALHAKTLGFVHPKTKQMIRFDSPLPADMQALIDKWRKYSENMSQFLEEE
jgi:23S rRNA pseudouridine1911/1915/1917 synthase